MKKTVSDAIRYAAVLWLSVYVAYHFAATGTGNLVALIVTEAVIAGLAIFGRLSEN